MLPVILIARIGGGEGDSALVGVYLLDHYNDPLAGLFFFHGRRVVEPRNPRLRNKSGDPWFQGDETAEPLLFLESALDPLPGDPRSGVWTSPAPSNGSSFRPPGRYGSGSRSRPLGPEAT